jgi:hypothetical protein
MEDKDFDVKFREGTRERTRKEPALKQGFDTAKCTFIFPNKIGLRKHIRTIHEGVSYPLTHSERVRRCKEIKISLYSEETLKEMDKIKNQTKNARLKAKI